MEKGKYKENDIFSQLEIGLSVATQKGVTFRL